MAGVRSIESWYEDLLTICTVTFVLTFFVFKHSANGESPTIEKLQHKMWKGRGQKNEIHSALQWGWGATRGTGVPNPKQYNIVRNTTICNETTYENVLVYYLLDWEIIIEKATSQYEFTTGVEKLVNRNWRTVMFCENIFTKSSEREVVENLRKRLQTELST